MDDLREIRAIVRLELLERTVHRLKEAGVPRMTVQRVHAIGAGVDPATARISVDEGTELAVKARIDFICASRDAVRLVGVLTEAARTGRRGDGIVSLHMVGDVWKIRTGAAGEEALR